MNDGAGLFQAILDDPEDTGLRLVYADWLEEHGDADRAEFIRVQCRLAEIGDDHPEWAELKARETALFVRHENEWLGPLREVASFHFARFRRGLAEHVSIDLLEFISFTVSVSTVG